LGIGFFAWMMLAASVWGAPTYPVQYIALISSILLVVSAFVCLFTPVIGRNLATLSILGVGTLYIPASASLVPAAHTLTSPVAYLLLLGYFALLSFALFFPTRWRWSTPLLVCCFLTSGAFAAATYFHRSEQGDIDWPSVVYFRWTYTPQPLQIEFVPNGWITSETMKALSQNGVTGVLNWSGATGSLWEDRRVVVVCRSRITVPKELFYPKQGTVIYIFDGTTWRSIPKQPNVYPAHATLTPDGMLEQDCPTGGRQGAPAFSW
jgi:hypothetical protein